MRVWRGKRQQGTLADRGGARVRGRSVGWTGGSGGRASSRWDWNGSQPGEGASELAFPRPALRKVQGEAARRAGEPSGADAALNAARQATGQDDPSESAIAEERKRLLEDAAKPFATNPDLR